MLVCLVVASLLWRTMLIQLQTLNPDELFVLGGASRVCCGLRPYLDYVVALAPLIYRIYSPLIGRLGETPACVEYFRWLHFIITTMLLATLFMLIRRLYNSRIALWTLGILSGFLFFIERTVHVRPDTPALLMVLLSLWVLTQRRGHVFYIKKEVLAGFGMAIAFGLHVTVLFCIVPCLIWLLVDRSTGGSWKGRGNRTLWFGIAFVLSYGCLFLVMFGADAPWALGYYLRMFELEKAYQESFDPHVLRIFFSILLGSFLNWVLLGWALVAGNVKWGTGRLANPYTRLFILLADVGIVFLVARRRTFEQHYIQLVLFGSLPAALTLLEWDKRAAMRFGSRGGFVGVLAAGVLGISAGLGAVSNYFTDEEKDRMEDQYVQEARRTFAGKEGSADVDLVRRWSRGRRFLSDPFYYRSKKHREAQLRFLLTHSKPDEVVFSDWLNPPYRNLPAPYHHGYMISLFYKSHRLSQDPELVRLIHRYDPYYRADDPGPGERMVRLFEATRPVVILVDGSIAELLVTSERFGQWLSERYTFVFDPESASLFALRLS